jgi:transposase
MNQPIPISAAAKGLSFSTLIVADRWYASRKLCSNCGYKLASLDLGIRQWTCPACHLQHDRDVTRPSI